MKFPRISHFLVAFTLMSFTVAVFLNISSTQAAFGTSPPWVRNDHLLPGTTFEQVINLSRSEADEAIKATAKVNGDKQLLKWITIPDEDELVMKEGQTILPMKVIVEVPKRAEIKNYVGNIFISLAPLKTESSLEGGEVGITLGANISVDITVIGEKIFDYNVQSISVDSLQAGSPFSLNLEIQNLGNVSISNANGQIEIYNSSQTEVIKSLDFIPLSESVAPDENKISKMIFEEVILDPGEYWVFVKAFTDGKVVYENRLPLEVKAKMVPVITPEDTISTKPSLPVIEEEADMTPSAIQVPVTDLRPAAQASTDLPKLYLIIGLAGLLFGLIALIAVVVVLIILLKSQQRATIKQQPARNIQVQPGANASDNKLN